MAPQGCLGIGELFGQIDVEFQEFAPLLKLNQSARSLVECYAAAPAVIA